MLLPDNFSDPAGKLARSQPYMENHYDKICRAHDMGFISTTDVGTFLETDAAGRERMLTELVDNLLSETMRLDDRITDHRQLVTELLHCEAIRAVAPNPILTALIERIRIRMHIDDNQPS